ncbi:hypothetical protein [Variovorax boronicumulans]|uniref:hypothetical protein n=1 Tax=Variovorax boronicumulans TaxID=436515 RepID=UPI0007856E74|nr:hypothetical protein [Variovorax boronicumulans]
MTSSASLANAWRLPRDFALITLAVEVALVLFHFGKQLWPGMPDSQQMLASYAQPDVWVPMMANLSMAWVLAAALAWSHARQALEVRGAASVAQLPGPHLRYAAVYLIALLLNHYALGPLLYKLQQMLFSGSWLQAVFGGFAVTSTAVVYEAVQLVVLVLSVWLAAWVALRAPAAAPSGDREVADAVQAGVSPRRAVATLVAVVFASLQARCMMAANIGTAIVDPSNGVALLLFWGGPPLVIFALSYWGGWLGTASGLTQVRPFRAVAASVLALVGVFASCVVVFVVGLPLMVTSSSGFSGAVGLIMLLAALVPLYPLLTVLLTRFITRRLYRPYL